MMLQRFLPCNMLHILAHYNPRFNVRSLLGSRLINRRVEGLSTLKQVSQATAGNVGKSAAGLATHSKFESNKLGFVSTMNYDTGYVYEGSWHEDKWAGEGKLTSVAGQVWEGEFKEGKIYKGAGTIVLSDGDVYEGKWRKGKMEGKGQWTLTNGSFLKGSFKNDLFHKGVGIMVNTDGTVLKGVWMEGSVDGELVKYNCLSDVSDKMPRKSSIPKAQPQNYKEVVNPDGSVLKGEFEWGRIYNGIGKEVRQDGSFVEGTWVKGRLSGKVKISYRNGDIYVGEVVDDGSIKRHGYGLMTKRNRDRLEGTWVEDKLQVQKSLTYPSGSTYEGEMVGRQRHGYGKMTYTDGKVYEGMFVKNHRRGKGKQTNANGTVLEGEWKTSKIYNGSGVLPLWSKQDEASKVHEGTWVKGKLQGQAKITDTRGNTYEGEVVTVDGVVRRVDGYGVMTYRRGEVYKGMWEMNSWCGKGILTNVDGSFIEGEFTSGWVHSGSGKFVSFEGNVYEGTWVDERFEGVITGRKGQIFEGECRDGWLYNGSGTYVSVDGDIYEGTCVEGIMMGKRTHPGGTVLEGEFRRDEIYNGSGVLGCPSGTVYEGTWVEGNLTGKCTKPKGYFVYGGECKGYVVEGEFRGLHIFNGKGIMVARNGEVHEGTWVEGKMEGPGRRSDSLGTLDEGEFREGKLVRSYHPEFSWRQYFSIDK